MPDFPRSKYPAAIETPTDLNDFQANAASVRAIEILLGQNPMENVGDASVKATLERLDTGGALFIGALGIVTPSFPDATGGATTSAGTVSVVALDATAIERPVVMRLDLSDTEFEGPGDPATNATMDTATVGSIMAGAGTNSLVIKTNGTGNFAATITNAVDETIYISARTTDGGTDAVGSGIVVFLAFVDSATFSA